MSDDPLATDPLTEPFDPADMAVDLTGDPGADLLADPLPPPSQPAESPDPAGDPIVEPVFDVTPPVAAVPPPAVETSPAPVMLEPEIPWDLDGDGLAQWDTDGDGAVDFVEQDQDQDGVVDVARIDLEFDGVMDHTGTDISGDGVMDTVETLPPPAPTPGAPVQLEGAGAALDSSPGEPTIFPASVTGLLEMPAPGVVDVTPINPFAGLVDLNEQPSSANSALFNFSGLSFGAPTFLAPGQSFSGSLADNVLGSALGQVEALLQAPLSDLLTKPSLPPRTPTPLDAIYKALDPQGQPLFGSTGVQLDPFVNIGGTGKLRALLAPIPGISGGEPLGSFTQGLPGFFVPGQQPVGALSSAIAGALQ